MLVLMRIVVTLLADAGSKISSCQQSVDSTSLEDGVRWLIRVTVVERTTPNRKKTHPHQRSDVSSIMSLTLVDAVGLHIS